jgi:hypothetical protein
MANQAVSFLIYTLIDWETNVEDSSIENVKTNEKLVIKTESGNMWKNVLISRFPLNAAKSWIEANEEEVLEWETEKLNRKINMDGEMKIAI